jgi:undecaprenyl-diphosphatase
MASLDWVQANVLSRIAIGDQRLMRRVNRWRAPRWIRLWMICATRGGDGWLWYALAFAVALFGGPESHMAILASGISVSLGIGLFLWLKKATNRRRPCAMEQHCWSTLLPPDQFSFPSGHTMTAFAMTVSMGLYYPSILPGLVFCSLSIAISRVVLGMHFLSDVLVGAALGSAIGYFVHSVLNL